MVRMLLKTLGITNQNSSHSHLASTGAFRSSRARRSRSASTAHSRFWGISLRRRAQPVEKVQVTHAVCPFSRQQSAMGQPPENRRPGPS